MPTEETMYKCRRCGRLTKHLEKKPSHVLHLLLTVLTVGLWIPVWAVLSASRGGAQCSECGKRRGAFGWW